MLDYFARFYNFQVLTGQTAYNGEFVVGHDSIHLTQIAAVNQSSATSDLRVGFSLFGVNYWFLELALVTQDILVSSLVDVYLPPEARLIFQIDNATAEDMVEVYLFGVIDHAI
jgi:hypothetical protein